MQVPGIGRRDAAMRILGKEIRDECQYCGEIFVCELFKKGHGIRCDRENVSELVACQMKHREKREKK